MTTLTIPGRFNGPPGSANGGWTAGALAARLAGGGAGEAGEAMDAALPGRDAAVVTLRRPPPLDTEMELRYVDGSLELFSGPLLIAEAAPGELTDDPLPPVPPKIAQEAATRYAAGVDHPFPTCYVCGTERRGGDGLALRPGPVGDGRVATPWIAPVEPSALLTWAALDCPGGWSVDLVGRPMVLGRMTARIHHVPAAGEPCVVVGAKRGQSGRKVFTATAAYGTDGRLLGEAAAIWIAVDPLSVSAP